MIDPSNKQPISTPERNMQTLREVATQLNKKINKMTGVNKGKCANSLALLVTFGVLGFPKRANDPNFRPFHFEQTNHTLTVTASAPKQMNSHIVTWPNPTNTAIEHEYNVLEKFRDEFSFSFKEGITIGASATVGFDVGVATAEFTVSVDLQFEATQAVTAERVVEYSSLTKFSCPPGKVTTINADISKVTQSGTWSVTMTPNYTQDFLGLADTIAPGGSPHSQTCSLASTRVSLKQGTSTELPEAHGR